MKQQLFNSFWIAAASVLISSPAFSQVVQVTGVQLNPTENGLEVILETPAGEQLQVLTRSEGDVFIADIPNTQLAIPEGSIFRSDNLPENIAGVTVTQFSANSVRITAIGKVGVPKAEVVRSDRGLILSVTPSTDTTAQQPQPTPEVPEAVQPESEIQPEETQPEEDDVTQKPAETEQLDESVEGEEEIEIVVTGEQETGYVAPNATTATRTDTPLRDIPQSIQVVPRQVLEEQQVTRIGEATRNVSGVTPQPGFGGATDNYTIRGFAASNNLRNGFRDDGFYSFTDPANIERVEVLKGPASVLYGQIEPGGVVNYITKQPLSEPYYAGEFTVGSYDFYRPSIDISGPLNSDETLLYRLNVAYENSGSFRDFVDKELFVFAPVLTYRISDATTLTLEYEYIDLHQTFDRGFPPLTEIFDLPISRFLGEPSDSYDLTAQKISYALDHRFNDDWRLRNAFSAQIVDNLRSNVQPSTFTLEDDGRTFQRVFTRVPNYNQVYSLQTDLIGNFNTGSIKHQILLGLELSKIIDEGPFFRTPFPAIDIFNPVYGLPIPTTFEEGFSSKTTTDNVGIYLQDSVDLLPNLKLLVGGRFDFINLEQEDVADIINGSEPEKTTRNYEAFSPRVGLVYQPIEPILLYASYSRSFNPNTSALTIDREPLEPERGTQYEVGIKTELLDGRLSATLAAYEITKSNVATPDPLDEEFSIAAGEIKSRGIELDVVGEIAPGWNIIASYGLNDAFVSEDNNLPEGDRLVNAPRNSASLWTTYEIQSGSLQGLGFGAGVFFVGDREAELPNTITIPSYVRTDATIFYRRDNWRAALNFRNLFDIKYYDSQGFLLYPGAPFTVLGSVSVEF